MFPKREEIFDDGGIDFGNLRFYEGKGFVTCLIPKDFEMIGSCHIEIEEQLDQRDSNQLKFGMDLIHSKAGLVPPKCLLIVRIVAVALVYQMDYWTGNLTLSPDVAEGFQN